MTKTLRKIQRSITDYQYVALHTSMIIGVAYGLYFCAVASQWQLFLISILLAPVFMFFGHNIAIHRLFSHRSFKTHRWVEILLGISSLFVGFLGPLAWVATHRHHHFYSDSERDFHTSNTKGILHNLLFQHFESSSTVLKRLNYKSWKECFTETVPADLLNDKFLVFVDKFYVLIWAVMGIVISGLFSFNVFLYGLLIPAGVVYITLLTITGTLLHQPGWPGSYRNYETNDRSLNSLWCQLITLGEGYQNNHHKYPNHVNHSMKPREVDPSAWFIDKFLSIKK